MNKLFADDPVQGNREFSFFQGYCVVLTSTVLVFIIPAGAVLFLPVGWSIALSILSFGVGLYVGKERWRRAIALAAVVCLPINAVSLAGWILGYVLTSAIDGWRIRKRRRQLFGLED